MRKNKEDAVIGSNVIPARTEILFLPTIQHTDSEFFADPLEFRPERWLDGSTSSEAQTAAYFPFSSGTAARSPKRVRSGCASCTC